MFASRHANRIRARQSLLARLSAWFLLMRHARQLQNALIDLEEVAWEPLMADRRSNALHLRHLEALTNAQTAIFKSGGLPNCYR